MQDPLTKKNLMVIPKSISETKEKVKRRVSAYKQKKPVEESFVIEINREFAGIIEIHDLNYDFSKHKARISYWLNKKFRGQGITTEALKTLTDYAFKKYKLKRIEGICRTFNKASARVLEKAGYKLEGILRKNKCKNGKYLDDMVFAKVN